MVFDITESLHGDTLVSTKYFRTYRVPSDYRDGRVVSYDMDYTCVAPAELFDGSVEFWRTSGELHIRLPFNVTGTSDLELINSVIEDANQFAQENDGLM